MPLSIAALKGVPGAECRTRGWMVGLINISSLSNFRVLASMTRYV